MALSLAGFHESEEHLSDRTRHRHRAVVQPSTRSAVLPRHRGMLAEIRAALVEATDEEVEPEPEPVPVISLPDNGRRPE